MQCNSLASNDRAIVTIGYTSLSDPGDVTSREVARIVGRLAKQLSRPGVDWQDLSQEALYHLWRRRDQWRQARGKWPVWVWMVARTYMHKYMMAKRSHLHNPMPDADILALCDDPLSQSITDLLESLREVDNRIVYLLAGLDGAAPRTTEETGWILGRHHSNVARAWRRLVPTLREWAECHGMTAD